jgi:hypothetical protein
VRERHTQRLNVRRKERGGAIVTTLVLFAMLLPSSLLAQKQVPRNRPPAPRRDTVRAAPVTEWSSVSVEPLTYWHSGFQVDCFGDLAGGSGPLHTHFFSSSFAVQSGLALSTRHFWRTKYGLLGVHSGMEWSMSRGRIFLEVPDYGVSFSEIDAELSVFDFWIGGFYVLPLKIRIPLRSFVTLDLAWMQTSLSLRSEGEKIGSNDDGLKNGHMICRYGLGVEYPLVSIVSIMLKYQRYTLAHSHFEPQKGLFLDCDHHNVYQLSLGLAVRVDT